MRFFVAIFTVCLIAIPICLSFFKEEKTETEHIISPISQDISLVKLPQKSIVVSPVLENRIQEILREREGTYGIYYKDLQTGAVYEKDSHMIFYSASLYKLWIMGEMFRQIDKGTLKKEEVLTQTVPTLNKKFGIASESAELREGTITFSVEDALENMITVSSNYAALLLSDRLRLSNVSNFLQTYAMKESNIGVPPKTSPWDIGHYFETLYKEALVGPLYSREMIAILKRQQLNDRLPKYLPESLEIAHKTGELDGYKHDAGIIFTPNGDYILVVLSKSNDEIYAAETIAQISKEVYLAREEDQ